MLFDGGETIMVYLKKAKDKYWYMYKSVRKGNRVTKVYLGRPNIFQFIYYKYIKNNQRRKLLK